MDFNNEWEIIGKITIFLIEVIIHIIAVQQIFIMLGG